SCSRATCPARSRRRRAAGSIPAAAMRPRSARRRSRRSCRTARPATWPPATTRSTRTRPPRRMRRRGPRRADVLVRAVALVAFACLVCACAGSGGGSSSAPGTHDVVRVDRPFTGAKAAALRYVHRVEAHTHPSRLRVRLALLSQGRHTETVLVTPSARFGGGRGTVWTGLGQRALVLARRGGQLRVIADITKSGRYAVLQDGAGAM